MTKHEVEKQLAGKINTSWRSSEYWERNRYGGLTQNGWAHALKDGEKLHAGLLAQAEDLGTFLVEVRRVMEMSQTADGEEVQGCSRCYQIFSVEEIEGHTCEELV